MKLVGWRLIPLLSFIGIAFFLGRGLFLEPQHIPSAQIGKVLPEFTLPNLLTKAKKITSTDFKHKMIILNVWASWCAACTQEQGLLLQLAKEGVPIYGLNYRDDPKTAKQWLIAWGNPYQSIAQDIDGKLAMDLGVYGAPETFLIDKKGIIRYRHVGILTESIWINTLLPLMKQWNT